MQQPTTMHSLQAPPLCSLKPAASQQDRLLLRLHAADSSSSTPRCCGALTT